MSSNTQDTSQPYKTGAETYAALGWTGVFPVRTDTKAPALGGVTGRPGVQTTAEQYTGPNALPRHASKNVALRLSRGLVGVDVDHYDNKRGGDVLAELESKLGALPETFWSTSREDGASGIRFYSVPDDIEFREKFGSNIECIQFHHRYAVVWPSVHKDTGNTYTWRYKGEIVDAPSPDQFPELPDAWVEHFTAPEREAIEPGTSYDFSPERAEEYSDEVAKIWDYVENDMYRWNSHTKDRHEVLRDCGNRVGNGVAAGIIDGATAAEELEKFIKGFRCTRKDERIMDSGGATKTIEDGIRNGAKNPLVVEPSEDIDFDPFEGAGSELSPRARKLYEELVAREQAEDAFKRRNWTVDDACVSTSWDDLWENTEDEPEWIAEGVIQRGELSAIYSGAGIGKSFLMQQICAPAVTGKSILGKAPRNPIRVLYIDFENTKRDWHRTLSSMGYGPGDDLSRLVHLSFPGIPPLDTKAGGRKMLELADEHKPDLVVIDTVSRMIAGPENDADTFLSAYRLSLLPLKRRGIAVVRLSHSGKEGSKGQRGSSAQDGDVDRVWQLVDHGGNDRLLRCDKNRGGERENIKLTVRDGVMVTDVMLTAGSGTKDYGICDFLMARDERGEPPATRKDIENGTGVSYTTLVDVLTNLVETGMIHGERKGRSWVYRSRWGDSRVTDSP